MKILLCFFTLFACSMTASAATFSSIEDRASAVRAELNGNNNYQAHLARELASIAEDEISQHDLKAARAFIKMSEEHAAQVGGAK
jgi:hypothetical protein